MSFHPIKTVTFLLLFLSQIFSQIIITEVMYNPEGSDSKNEFVELFNTSSVTSINLTGWTIANKKDFDYLEDTGDSLILPPLTYAIILDDDYEDIYNSIIPTGAILIGGGSTIGGGGLLLSDAVYLKDSAGTLIDRYGWADPAPDNYSIEKVWLDQPNTPDNWKPSKKPLGTPGAPNSVVPLNIDGKINNNIIFTPRYPKPGKSVIATVTVENAGVQNIGGIVSAAFNNNIIGYANSPVLSSRATAIINIPLNLLPSGRHKITFQFSVDNDDDFTNNTAVKKLGVAFSPGTVTINEFHAKPGEGQIEFIELVSTKSIVMDGWVIADKSSGKLLPITYIETGEYAVLASDTSMKSITNPDAHYLIPYGGLPTLNNSGDGIYLLDMNHTVIDSLIYDSGWPVVSDSSTEKLRPDFISNDPANWKTSTASASMTPGYENSVYLINNDGAIISDGIYHEPDFPKSNETIQLFLPVTNHGAQAISGKVSIIDNNVVIGDIGFTNIARRDTSILQIALSAMNSGIHPLKIKLEIGEDQLLENNNAIDTIFVSYDFGDILINEFLPQPTSAQAEFVELISFDDIDLTNWSIADKTNTLHYFNGGLISDNRFIVLSEDPPFATIIPTEATFIEVENFPSLNNYGDTIYLRDFTGTVIDSLVYTTWWELATGKSTEKIHPEFVSNDSTGWKVSTDSTGMTPGRPNSVVVKNIDGLIVTSDIITAPDFPGSTDEVTLTIPITNNGLQIISGEISAEWNNQIIANTAFNPLAVSDTLFIYLTLQPLPSGLHDIKLYLDINGDENLDNNSATISLGVSYDFGIVTINEFLSDPESPLSEFVEIVTLDTVDLTGWAISDNRKEPKEFSAGPVTSGKYIVLSEDTSLTALLPSEAVFVNIDNFPSLNNSGDGIFIYDFTGKIIDSLNYNNSDWSLKSGKSIEKLHPDFLSNDATRWQVCTDSTNTTIGRVNSTVMQNVNGAILPMLTKHSPEYPHPNESISFEIAVINSGVTDIFGSVLVNQYDNELAVQSFDLLKSEDTTYVTFNIEPLGSGYNLIDIILKISGDMNPADNSIEHSVYVNYPFGTVVFNEFLAQPDSNQAEFVELISFNDIDLSGWAISDKTGTKHYFGKQFTSANQPIVIASDSTFINNLPQGTSFIVPSSGLPILNNSSDALFLYDMTGTIIDSLYYNSEWPITNGRSTEKFRPEFESNNPIRWGVAVNVEAMTPGLENSLHFDELPTRGAIALEVNPFSPNGDGIDDELLIKYKLPFEQGIVKLQIFDMMGRNIATPYWNVYFPQEGILKWDGKLDGGDNARIGIYIVKVTARDPATSRTWEKVKTVVLAKRL